MARGEEAVHCTADVAPSASLGTSVRIWHIAQVREDAFVGDRTTIGRGAYIGPGVRVGADVKIQNYALLYEPAVIEDGAFVGPAVVLTNDLHPRAVRPDGVQKTSVDWTPRGVIIRRGASLGARSVCIGPVHVGEWAMVAAGAVVRHDVQAHSLVVGVPARHVGWVGRSGERLVTGPDGRWLCRSTGEVYREGPEGLSLTSRPAPDEPSSS